MCQPSTRVWSVSASANSPAPTTPTRLLGTILSNSNVSPLTSIRSLDRRSLASNSEPALVALASSIVEPRVPAVDPSACTTIPPGPGCPSARMTEASTTGRPTSICSRSSSGRPQAACTRSRAEPPQLRPTPSASAMFACTVTILGLPSVNTGATAAAMSSSTSPRRIVPHRSSRSLTISALSYCPAPKPTTSRARTRT